jgi:uncharacterized protein YbjT (DUF2867 family)
MKDGLVTLFGGGGFLGRYVAQELLKAGARVRIAQRDPRQAWFLKPLGGLGQTQFVAADITRADSVARAVTGSDSVVNLVGILKGNFRRVHVDGAATVARAAREAGAESLVQLSAIGADPASPSAYGRSKGEGEAAVREAFPRATILRPSIVFGREDQFINRFAGMIRMMPVVPVIGGATKFQPVFVGDVARAVVAAIADPARYGGKTYELGGPEIVSMAELNNRIAEWTGRDRSFLPVPDAAAGAMARLTGWAPGAPMTWDQWQMLQSDNVVPTGADGLATFGITATPMATVVPEWLVQYRRHGRFAGAKTA